ncbi:hypothetical protein ACP4OV_003331 [Aristida adscensionis]
MADRPSSSMAHLALLLLSLALLLTSLQAQGGSSGRRPPSSSSSSSSSEVFVPVRRVVYRSSALPAARTTAAAAAYEPFEVCSSGCRCCAASNASSCVETSCCYAIDCDLPGKPFGVCAFTPRSCGCAAAAAGGGNCTQSPS